MKTILLSAALSLAAILPAAAQMAPPPGPPPGPMNPMNPMNPMSGAMMSGPSTGGMSCVSGGQFVPCPPPGMQPGMGMGEPMPRRRMSKREMRRQQMMMRQQQQGM